MTCHTKEQLEEMLFDVVNELDLSDGMCEKHGPWGTAPAILVREVMDQKDQQIRMLRQGFKEVGQIDPRDAKIAALEAEREAMAKERDWAFGRIEQLENEVHYAPAKDCERCKGKGRVQDDEVGAYWPCPDCSPPGAGGGT